MSNEINENVKKIFEEMAKTFDSIFEEETTLKTFKDDGKVSNILFKPYTKEDLDKESESEDKLILTYDNIQKHMNEAANLMGNRYDTILCITRGGLIPAGMLAYQLNIKNIININITSYDDNNNQGQIVLEKLSKKDIKKIQNAKRILIVDDIIDTGDTIKTLDCYLSSKCFKNVKWVESPDVFAIVSKNLTLSKYYIYNMTGDSRWVVMPWDRID